MRLRQAAAEGGNGLRFGGVWTAVIITHVAVTGAFPATAFFGFTVTAITKNVGFGLQWADIVNNLDCTEFRLPHYPLGLPQFAGVALALEARAVVVDQLFLDAAEQTQPPSGAFVVTLLKGAGFSVWGFTVDDEPGWDFLKLLGVDGIFINDIPLGLRLQAPLDAP